MNSTIDGLRPSFTFRGRNNGSSTVTSTPADAPLSGSRKEEKYSKRLKKSYRSRNQEDRFRQAVLVFAASLVFLFYTCQVVMDDNAAALPNNNNNNNSNKLHLLSKSSAYGHHEYHGGEPLDDRDGRHHKRRRQQRQQQLELQQQHDEQKQGLFDKMLGRNPKIQALQDAVTELNEHIIHNIDNGIHWANPGYLPPLHSSDYRPLTDRSINTRDRRMNEFFKVRHQRISMDWESELNHVDLDKGPHVDYTQHFYEYPEKIFELPPLGEYPKLKPMKQIMEIWPQDNLDNPPSPFHEGLLHFDFTDPKDLEAATRFRDAKLPFKLINVPEVVAAGEKWTDEYVMSNFDVKNVQRQMPRASGTCQESASNFFPFFQAQAWKVEDMGLPPTRDTDWTFEKWATHARYADAVGLSPHQPHFYWQSGVPKEERHQEKDHWTFVSRDLPSFSSPTETFFVFEPESQKGIQCRFGERGVTAANHYDTGRNMIAMMTGAKRYILSPPKECRKLGIVPTKGNPMYRHSMLNYGHLNDMDHSEMPAAEREWMEVAGEALAIDTVLKAGEVLFIPSHWFHYITSLQKSGQCNVRSGIDAEGDSFFGGQDHVTKQCDALLD